MTTTKRLFRVCANVDSPMSYRGKELVLVHDVVATTAENAVACVRAVFPLMSAELVAKEFKPEFTTAGYFTCLTERAWKGQ